MFMFTFSFTFTFTPTSTSTSTLTHCGYTTDYQSISTVLARINTSTVGNLRRWLTITIYSKKRHPLFSRMRIWKFERIIFNSSLQNTRMVPAKMTASRVWQWVARICCCFAGIGMSIFKWLVERNYWQWISIFEWQPTNSQEKKNNSHPIPLDFIFVHDADEDPRKKVPGNDSISRRMIMLFVDVFLVFVGMFFDL